MTAAALTHTPKTACALAAKARCQSPSDLSTEYFITKNDMVMIYMSPDPYFEAFQETISLRKFDIGKHRMAGLCLAQDD